MSDEPKATVERALPLLRPQPRLARFAEFLRSSHPVWLLVGVLAVVVTSLSLSILLVIVLSPRSQPPADMVFEPGDGNERNRVDRAARPASDEDELKRVSDSVADLVEKVKPAVVKLVTNGGLGSGFVVGENQIITNYHVVEGESEITVLFPSGRAVLANGWLGIASELDLALVSVPCPDDVDALPIADALPRQGERVLAIGAPRGLSGSVSEGIVSAIRTNRELIAESTVPTRSKESPDLTWVQTSASILPGNSGGPLVNLRGQVVGVNTQGIRSGNALNLAVSCSDISGFLRNAGHEIRAFSDLPVRRPDPTELAIQDSLKREKEANEARKQAELRERAQAALDRERADTKRQKQASELADRSQKENARQQELNRIEAALRTLRAELTQIELEGTQLTTLRGSVIAQGAAISVEVNQIASRFAFIDGRLRVTDAAIRKRRSFMAGGPQFLDSESASYDAAGVGRLQAEAILLNREIPILQLRLQTLEATYAGLQSQANDLAVQILYKVKQREQRNGEIATAARGYQELSRAP